MKPVSPQDQTYPPRKPEDMNPYPMVRCSSKRQRFGDTDTRQTENAKLECARRGWPWKPELIVRDLGVSAYHAMNFKPSSELGRFIEAAEKQLLLPNPVLICENPDRFSRAQIDNADGTLWRLVRYGVDVLFMSGSLYLTRGDENDAATRTRIIWEFDRSRKESQRKAFFAGATMTRKLREASEGRKVDFGTHLPVWIDFNKGPIPSYSLRGLTTSSFAVCSFAVLIIFCALTVAWMTCGPSLVIAIKPGFLFRNIRGTKPDTVESLRRPSCLEVLRSA